MEKQTWRPPFFAYISSCTNYIGISCSLLRSSFVHIFRDAQMTANKMVHNIDTTSERVFEFGGQLWCPWLKTISNLMIDSSWFSPTVNQKHLFQYILRIKCLSWFFLIHCTRNLTWNSHIGCGVSLESILSSFFFGLTCKRTITYITLSSHFWLIKVASVGFFIHKMWQSSTMK